MTPCRVLIADDHPIFRDGLRSLLEAAPEVDVVGEATSGDEAVALAVELQPDVVLMDVRMPGLNGIEATRRLATDCPLAKVLIVTMLDDDETVFSAMRAGARGFMLKEAGRETILRAIEAVANGEGIFSPGIATRLLEFFASPHPLIPRALFPELTEREREVLDLIARGANNQSIAHRLSLSVKTVSNYVSTILSKLQVADRAEAIVRARDAGLGRSS